MGKYFIFNVTLPFFYSEKNHRNKYKCLTETKNWQMRNVEKRQNDMDEENTRRCERQRFTLH